MSDELTELLDAAMYKEIASQAFYIAGQSQTPDPGAKALLGELAGEELRHSRWLKNVRESGIDRRGWHRQPVPDLMMSQYLVGADTVAGAGLQDVLIVAIKREQQSIEFYARMMGVMRDESAKRLCQRLVQAELRHKLKLETLYDDLFYAED